MQTKEQIREINRRAQMRYYNSHKKDPQFRAKRNEVQRLWTARHPEYAKSYYDALMADPVRRQARAEYFREYWRKHRAKLLKRNRLYQKRYREQKKREKSV